MTGISLQLMILGYVLVAALLGALIGFEREMSDKPAGIRTHALVGGAAALLVALGEVLVNTTPLRGNNLNADPVRIVEAIVAGVSFLGAGTILRRGGQMEVEGLTTAASLLFAAVIGISVGAHRLILAAGATVLVLIILRSGAWVGQRRDSQKSAANQEE